jgi:Arc/MetJ-type ribon-helix-helix transcriptional regulator
MRSIENQWRTSNHPQFCPESPYRMRADDFENTQLLAKLEHLALLAAFTGPLRSVGKPRSDARESRAPFCCGDASFDPLTRLPVAFRTRKTRDVSTMHTSLHGLTLCTAGLGATISTNERHLRFPGRVLPMPKPFDPDTLPADIARAAKALVQAGAFPTVEAVLRAGVEAVADEAEDAAMAADADDAAWLGYKTRRPIDARDMTAAEALACLDSDDPERQEALSAHLDALSADIDAGHGLTDTTAEMMGGIRARLGIPPHV